MRLKRIPIEVIFSVILILSAGCSANLKTMYDKNTDFSKFKSWCWLQGCEFTFSGPAYMDDSLIRERIRKAITHEMESDGLAYNADYPDLLLDFHVTVSDEVATQFHPQFDRDFNDTREFEQTEIQYLKGTLIIDMVDHSTNRMVWRSVAIGYYDHHPEISEENINKGIHLVMKQFPPKGKVQD